jgi:penicillin-binding protein 2
MSRPLASLVRAAALIAVGAVAVCQRAAPSCEAPPLFRDAVVPVPRGTIHDRAGRVLAVDGDAGRAYPFGHLAAHAIGYVATSADGELIGRSGVEAAWDDTLRGSRGVRRVPIGEQGRDLGEGTILTRALPGRDVTLTLDMDLMAIVERAFEGYASGAVVLVDVHDGSVRALFSAPSIDPVELSGVLTDERVSELHESEALVDRAIERSRRPGGTIKTLTVLAGLEAGVDGAEPVFCTGSYPMDHGRRARDWAAHGETDARHAIATSCASYAFDTAHRVGLDALAAVYEDFGLGSRTGLGLLDEVPGIVQDAREVDLANGTLEEWTFSASIGEGAMRATPLQLAMAYAAIANGGTLWTPRIVAAITAPGGTATEELSPRVDHVVRASPEHLAFLRDALDGAVNEESGTGYAARSARVRIAGKTGHDRSSGWEARSTWFVGYAPADDPQVAIVVLLDDDDASRPARVAARILEDYLPVD